MNTPMSVRVPSRASSRFDPRTSLVFALSIAVACALFFAGCASPRKLAGLEVPDDAELRALPSLVRVPVVLIAQNDGYSCATTSVAMAISHLEGRDDFALDKDEAWAISRSSEDEVRARGNDVAGLSRVAAHFGYESEFVEGLSVRDLEFLLSRGIPVTVFVRTAADGSRTHAMLAVGYDRRERVVFFNDPALRVDRMRYAELERVWSAWLSRPRKEARRAGFIAYRK